MITLLHRQITHGPLPDPWPLSPLEFTPNGGLTNLQLAHV